MTLAQTSIALRLPLDGRHRQMFIDGAWVDARWAAQWRPAIRPPARSSPQCRAAIVRTSTLAVAAARKAFDGPWSRFKPYERQVLLLKIADLFEKHWEEIGAPTPQTWACRSCAPAPTATASSACCAITPAWRPRCMARPSGIRCRRDRLLHPQGAGRRRRRHHPLERADSGLDLEDRPALATGCTIVLKPPRKRR